MIDIITINKFLTYRPVDLKLAKYNLFIGKNGSGKSAFLRMLSGRFPITEDYDITGVQDSKPFIMKPNIRQHLKMRYIHENRILANFPYINLDIGQNYALEESKRPLESLWRDDTFRKQINEFVRDNFNRQIIDIKNVHEGVGLFYEKNNNKIPPPSDGFGIINSVKVLHILLSSIESTIAIEEPTIGFNPSITSNFLEYLVKNTPNDKQFIFTSQDFVFIIEFIKLFESRDDFKIFKFSDFENQITITEVTELEAIASDMSDSFPTKEDMKLISKIFVK